MQNFETMTISGKVNESRGLSIDFSRCLQLSANVPLPFFLSRNVERYFHRILPTWNRKYRFFFSLSIHPSGNDG